jgi:hypothetical protein
MFLFRIFHTYVVKVTGGHPQTNAESLNIILHSMSNNNLRATHAASMFAKHRCIWSTTELCSNYKCIYFTLLSTFMIKYVYSSFADTYLSLFHGRIIKMLSLMRKVLASSTLERG